MKYDECSHSIILNVEDMKKEKRRKSESEADGYSGKDFKNLFN